MGLDQYAFHCDPKYLEGKEVDFVLPEGADKGEFFYWRKHPNINGWMNQLYLQKGGQESFNCVPVILNEADLARLEVDIILNALPKTSGFFFGKSEADDYEKENDLLFVRQARELIANGRAVFYYSWW